MQRIAVVLFNLGGPLENKDVRPFLYNLFSDRNIIGLPFGLEALRGADDFDLARKVSEGQLPTYGRRLTYIGGDGGPERRASGEAVERS